MGKVHVSCMTTVTTASSIIIYDYVNKVLPCLVCAFIGYVYCALREPNFWMHATEDRGGYVSLSGGGVRTPFLDDVLLLLHAMKCCFIMVADCNVAVFHKINVEFWVFLVSPLQELEHDQCHCAQGARRTPNHGFWNWTNARAAECCQPSLAPLCAHREQRCALCSRAEFAAQLASMNTWLHELSRAAFWCSANDEVLQFWVSEVMPFWNSSDLVFSNVMFAAQLEVPCAMTSHSFDLAHSSMGWSKIQTEASYCRSRRKGPHLMVLSLSISVIIFTCLAVTETTLKQHWSTHHAWLRWQWLCWVNGSPSRQASKCVCEGIGH